MTYVLIRKRVKNLNLRVSPRGEITLSVPMRFSAERADAFIREKSVWLHRALIRQEQSGLEPLPEPERPVAVEYLNQAVEVVYPLVAPLGITFPMVKVRALKSQWGNCHWRQGYITLNLALARCPRELREYVALHELVHFLHHDHGPGFYARMDTLMPDWKERRRELRRYGQALETTQKDK